MPNSMLLQLDSHEAQQVITADEHSPNPMLGHQPLILIRSSQYIELRRFGDLMPSCPTPQNRSRITPTSS